MIAIHPMSSPKRLVYHCSATALTAASFSNNAGSLCLDSLDVEPLRYEPSEDSQWLPSVAIALKHIVARTRMQGEAVILAPGFQLLTKNIKVPHVEQARQAQIVAFEAGNNLPKPLSEFAWDYQVIADDGVEAEIIGIFAEHENITNLCRVFSNNGVTPACVAAETVLDINAWRYVYPEAQESTLLINISARSSNLLFITGDDFFVRTIQQGDNNLTQSIADNLGVNFEEAQRLKNEFFVGDEPPHFEAATVNMLESNAEGYFKRLNQDITRSVVNFRRQKNGQAPGRILVCGRGSRIRGLTEFLAQHQKVEVSAFDPLAEVEIGSGVNPSLVEENRPALVAVIGEAARSVITDPFSVNLLPESLRNEMRFAKQKPLIAAAALIAAISPLPWWLQLSAKADLLEQRLLEKAGITAPLYELSDGILQNRELADSLGKKVADLEHLVNTRTNWIEFLAKIQSSLERASHVWLESLKVEPGDSNAIQLSGRLLIHDFDPDDPEASFNIKARERVNEVIDQFAESPFVRGVRNLRFETSNPRILGFSLTLVTDPDRPL